jgi:hypothetical protein
MVKGVETLDLIGLGNAGLLVVCVCPAALDIVESVNNETMPEDMAAGYTHLMRVIPREEVTFVDSVVTYSKRLADFCAETTSLQEFEFIMAQQRRLFSLWKSLEEEPDSTSEEQIMGQIRMKIAQAVASQMTEAWAIDTKATIPATNVFRLVEALIRAMGDGSYFTGRMWNRKLKLAEDGNMDLTDETYDGETDSSSLIGVDDDWSAFDQEIPIH